MILHFLKYHGSGNDFIFIDNRNLLLSNYKENKDLIAFLCHRRFGIGADGLILINKSTNADFKMNYFNADGKEGSMCGNGGLCSVAFANYLGMLKNKVVFEAIDGLHEAEIIKKDNLSSLIRLKMQDVSVVKKTNDSFILDTGSPHYVCFRNNIKDIDVNAEGRKIRYSGVFGKKGINVNFAEIHKNHIYVRTYERGVEDETHSCGTGSVASALSASLLGSLLHKNKCEVRMKGGQSLVHFHQISKTSFDDIWLEGTAKFVFEGEINIS